MSSFYNFTFNYALPFLFLAGVAFFILGTFGFQIGIKPRSISHVHASDHFDTDGWLGAESHLHAEAQLFLNAVPHEARALGQPENTEKV